MKTCASRRSTSHVDTSHAPWVASLIFNLRSSTQPACQCQQQHAGVSQRHGHRVAFPGAGAAGTEEQLQGCRAVAADWSTALDYRATTGTRPAFGQPVSHVSTPARRPPQRARARIAHNKCRTNHGRTTRAGALPQSKSPTFLFQLRRVSLRRVRDRRPPARLDSCAVLLFISIIFSSVINAHKYCGKSRARKSYLVWNKWRYGG